MKWITLPIVLCVFLFVSCKKEKVGPQGKEGVQGVQGQQGATGPQGEPGAIGLQGPQGEAGNANVSAYNFSVSKIEWTAIDQNYGENNRSRMFEVLPDLTGGKNLKEVYDEGGVVCIYASQETTGGYAEWKSLPYIYSRQLVDLSYIGIKLEYLPVRRRITIAKTTNGWDSLAISDAELPDNFHFRIVIVEGMGASRLALPPSYDYETVCKFYKLNP